jgi:CDGSH-type Zn-finger protein
MAENESDSKTAPATITPYLNGPYLVRGDFAVLDQDGNEIRRSRKTIALCRCGKSRSKPFCDGTHKVIGFTAPSAAEPPRPLTTPATGSGEGR